MCHCQMFQDVNDADTAVAFRIGLPVSPGRKSAMIRIGQLRSAEFAKPDGVVNTRQARHQQTKYELDRTWGLNSTCSHSCHLVSLIPPVLS